MSEQRMFYTTKRTPMDAWTLRLNRVRMGSADSQELIEFCEDVEANRRDLRVALAKIAELETALRRYEMLAMMAERDTALVAGPQQAQRKLFKQ